MDFTQFSKDIEERKLMLKELNYEARRMQENLRMAAKLKDTSQERLLDYSDRYCRLIKVNIVLIQRWWRGVRMRIIFRTAVARSIAKEKKLNQA